MNLPDQSITWNTRILQKKDTDTNWASNNPVLLLNELIIVELETGECRFKIGDGVHAYKDLPFLDQLLRDEVGAKVSKEEGKALSSNDFTDDLKNKLDGISIMKGATADADGTSGLVPSPTQGADSKFLRGDGAWATPPTPNKVTNASHADEVPWSGVSGKPNAFPPSPHNHDIADLTTGVLQVSRGGTGATTVKNARYTLGVPAELGIVPGIGFPFGYGVVVCRGGLGNTIGQSTDDNYYWGVDSDAKLWGGKQTGGATSPTWARAAMMDGELGFSSIYTGVLTSGSATVTNGDKYAAWMIGAIPDPVTEAMVVQCVPGGIYEGRIYSGDRWIQFRIESQNKTITIRSSSHGGSIEVIWGLLKYTP